jgi:chromosome partitioning protein
MERTMKTIAVCSFKGGTAKTSAALHAGSALAKYHGQRVLLVDFDSQANMTSGLGFDPDTNDSLAPVLQGQKTIDKVILKTGVPRLDLIPADTWLERVEVTGSLAQDRYSHEKLKKLLQELSYDIAIIDTPPSLSWLTESALIASDYTLVCATCEFYSIKGLERLSQFIQSIKERHPLELLGVLLSFWNPRSKRSRPFLEIIDDLFPNKLLESRIRRDSAISEAALRGKPIFETHPKSRASQDFQSLAEELQRRFL